MWRRSISVRLYRTAVNLGDRNGPPFVDLRSDTKTVPSKEMRAAMAEAVVGDDVFGEDPTVNELERRCAELFGTESALFTTSGCMANLLAIMVHCNRRGSELVVGLDQHIQKYEQGSYAQFAGVSATTLPNEADGTIDLGAVEQVFCDGGDLHRAATRLLCLENTHNNCGGRVLTPTFMGRARSLADRLGFRIHVDGARIFNAAVAAKLPVSALVGGADSVCMCLSKGIGAPFGSVLGGSDELIKEARRLRKGLGGGMRQAGIMAAAGLVGLADAPRTLENDHIIARQLAQGVKNLKSPLIEINVNAVETNILLLKTSVDAPQLCEELESASGPCRLLCFPTSDRSLRWMTHWDLPDDAVQLAVDKLQFVLAKY